jgi:hypothetical protein
MLIVDATNPLKGSLRLGISLSGPIRIAATSTELLSRPIPGELRCNLILGVGSLSRIHGETIPTSRSLSLAFSFSLSLLPLLSV